MDTLTPEIELNNWLSAHIALYGEVDALYVFAAAKNFFIGKFRRRKVSSSKSAVHFMADRRVSPICDDGVS